METKHMFVDTDSIFFKIAYKSKNQSELRKNYNTFCNNNVNLIAEMPILFNLKGFWGFGVLGFWDKK